MGIEGATGFSRALWTIQPGDEAYEELQATICVKLTDDDKQVLNRSFVDYSLTREVQRSEVWRSQDGWWQEKAGD
jgi:hypothetical protein